MSPVRRFALAASLFVVALGSGVVRAAGQSDTKPGKTEAPRPSDTKQEAHKPGKDRWLVKTASDPDAHEIRPEPVKTTVESLLAIPRPEDLARDESNPWLQDHRIRPVETTVWTVEADVIGCQLMPDGDYRVTIRGASGQTMVLEMPNPDPQFVDPKSPFAPKIKLARSQFESKQQPDRSAKEMKGHAIFTGIGFFGRAYTKAKKSDEMKGNLIQLHPVLNIEWLPTPTKEFTPPAEPEKKPEKPMPSKPAGPASAPRP